MRCKFFCYKKTSESLLLRMLNLRFSVRAILFSVAGLTVLSSLSGCGDANDTPVRPVGSPDVSNSNAANKALPDVDLKSASAESVSGNTKPNETSELPSLSFSPDPPDSAGSIEPDKSTDSAAAASTQADVVSHANSIVDDGCLPQRRLGPLELVDVDAERLAAAGLTELKSQHLRLICEPATKDQVEEFPEVFDQAVQEWVQFFEADPRRFENWQVTCFFIVDESKFSQAGLIPDAQHLPSGKLPPGGWEFGNQIWVNQHPGDYYNRHMLLHEGTHAFCFYNYGNLGPPWLAEGLAEHLAVHSWQNQKLKLADLVSDKRKLEYWGRVKIIQDAWFDGQPKSIGEVMKFAPQDFPATESYAWSWAAVMMFDRHSRLHDAFHQALAVLHQHSNAKWNELLLEKSALDNDQLKSQWDVLISEMTYGYDLEKAEIQWSPKSEAPAADFTIELKADGAWHDTGFSMPSGRWQLDFEGMFQIAKRGDEPLISTATGVSVQYFSGARIGELQAAVDSTSGFFQSSSKLTAPMRITESGILEVTEPGKLFLRINDHPSFLNDNQGVVQVRFSSLSGQ